MAPERLLEGKTAVVTGALGRLGPGWVSALASAGARVVGIDVRSTGSGEFATAVADSFSLELASVTDRPELDEIVSRIGAPDVLVNSAGIDQPPDADGGTRRIEDIPIDEFSATVETNLAGVFACTQVFGGAMARAGRGSIINIGSLYASIAPVPAFYDHLDVDPPFLKPPAYGASKAGVVNLTRYFARLWGPLGVRVNALSPGGVSGGQDAVFQSKYNARVPLGRMAEPEDLKGPLLFLATDASRYMTGQELLVDGGFTA